MTDGVEGLRNIDGIRHRPDTRGSVLIEVRSNLVD